MENENDQFRSSEGFFDENTADDILDIEPELYEIVSSYISKYIFNVEIGNDTKSICDNFAKRFINQYDAWLDIDNKRSFSICKKDMETINKLSEKLLDILNRNNGLNLRIIDYISYRQLKNYESEIDSYYTERGLRHIFASSHLIAKKRIEKGSQFRILRACELIIDFINEHRTREFKGSLDIPKDSNPERGKVYPFKAPDPQFVFELLKLVDPSISIGNVRDGISAVYEGRRSMKNTK